MHNQANFTPTIEDKLGVICATATSLYVIKQFETLQNLSIYS
jgi:hypothetical protein